MNPARFSMCAAAALLVGFSCCGESANLAAGKLCRFSAQTNYGPCNDERDAWQLTDGDWRRSSDKGLGWLWVSKSCVGWCRKTGVRSITVDLGESHDIGGFACNMAGGFAGVKWPKSIKMYVCDDGSSWRYAGDLWAKSVAATGAPNPDAYSVYRVFSDDMPCRGRHVMFLIEQEPFTFLDEIEVLPAAGKSAKSKGVAVPDPVGHHYAELVRRHVRADAGRIREAAAGLSGMERAALERELDAALERSESFVVPDHDAFETPIPLCDAHADVFAVNARLMRAAGIVEPTLWTNSRWENLDPLAIPAASACADKPIRTEMMRGERRAVSVNIANPRQAPLVCRVSVSGLSAAAHAELAEVMYTETPALKCVSSALRFVPEGEPLSLTVLPGTSKQIWLSFARPALGAGRHVGKLSVAIDDGSTLERGVEVVVHDFDMPSRPRLHIGGWEYSDCHYKTPELFVASYEQMRRMLIDTPCATSRVLPQGAVFNEDGTLANRSSLNHDFWDRWIKLWPDARIFAVFVNPPHEKFNGEKLGTPRFEKMVGEYYRAFYDHAKKTGLGNRRIVLHLVDEPALPSLPPIIVAWEKAIKKGCPELSVMENPTFAKPEEVPPEMFDLADVLCPQMWEMHKGGNVPFFAKRAQMGQETWVYSCNGPSRDLSPVSYYIAQAYLAFQMGACGSYFWQFGDGGGGQGSWHAYGHQHDESSPYFAAKGRAMPAKQGEAVLESVYDFEYMSMLSDMIKSAKSAGRDTSDAERVLAEAPRRVLGQNLSGSDDYRLGESERWNEFRSHNAAERSRILVLRALSKLKSSAVR